MARKRMIDPSIWTDEGMAELSPIEQVLYIGLFSIADDDGRLKASPVYLRLALPTILGDVDKAHVTHHLDNILRHMTQLKRYSIDGAHYLVFANYAKWQRIDKPQPSQLPAPQGFQSANDPGTFDEQSTNNPGTVPPNRREEKGREGKGKEEKKDATPSPRAPRKYRLPLDWTPSEENRAFARERGLSDAEIDTEADKFRDHFTGINPEARPGWDASWRKWIQRELERPRSNVRPLNGKRFNRDGSEYVDFAAMAAELKAQGR